METREERNKRVRRARARVRARQQRRITILTIIMIVLMITVFVSVLSFRNRENTANYQYTTTTSYYVSEGETLWSIAQQYSDNRHDIRIVIDEIKTLSQCDSNLQISQHLTVPLYDVLNSDDE